MHEISLRCLLRGRSLVATRSQPKLLAQGKPRTLGGSTRPWRVRLYAPGAGTDTHQVYCRAPAGEDESWKRVPRRAASEEEARRIFSHAEAALDTESETPVGADVWASRTIRMLGEEYVKDSIERGKQPRRIRRGCAQAVVRRVWPRPCRPRADPRTGGCGRGDRALRSEGTKAAGGAASSCRIRFPACGIAVGPGHRVLKRGRRRWVEFSPFATA